MPRELLSYIENLLRSWPLNRKILSGMRNQTLFLDLCLLGSLVGNWLEPDNMAGARIFFSVKDCSFLFIRPIIFLSLVAYAHVLSVCQHITVAADFGHFLGTAVPTFRHLSNNGSVY